jgi:hypothetical protein
MSMKVTPSSIYSPLFCFFSFLRQFLKADLYSRPLGPRVPFIQVLKASLSLIPSSLDTSSPSSLATTSKESGACVMRVQSSSRRRRFASSFSSSDEGTSIFKKLTRSRLRLQTAHNQGGKDFYGFSRLTRVRSSFPYSFRRSSYLCPSCRIQNLTSDLLSCAATGSHLSQPRQHLPPFAVRARLAQSSQRSMLR